MGVWGIVVRLMSACSSDSDATLAEDTGGFGGIDRASFDRLFQERFCAEYAVCSDGNPCPLAPGAPWLPTNCDYDPNAGQACVVDHWSCATGSGYPIEPDSCGRVCRQGSTYDYPYGYP